MLLSLQIGLLALAFLLPISIAGTNIALGLVTVSLLAAWTLGARPEWRKAWGPAGAGSKVARKVCKGARRTMVITREVGRRGREGREEAWRQ